MRVMYTDILICDGCFHRVKNNETLYLAQRIEDDKFMNVCVRCLK